MLVVVGLIGSRGVASQEDFSVAGRKLSVFVLFGTMLATWIGTGSIFGYAEKVYIVGISAWILPAPAGALYSDCIWGKLKRENTRSLS